MSRSRNPSPGVFWGGVLVLLGVLFLLGNLGVLSNASWDYIWPLALIAVGGWLIVSRIGPGSASASVDSAAPREEIQRGRLELAIGAAGVDVRAAPLQDQLYRAHVEYAGSAPDINLDRPSGTLRIGQRLDWFMGARRLSIDTQLSDAVPWDVSCSTGAIRGTFDLSSTTVGSFACRTGASHIELTLGAPKGVVPIRIEGGALTFDLIRPTAAAVKVDASGAAVHLRADGAQQDGVGSRTWRSTGFDAATDRYEVVVSGAAITVNIGSA